MRVFNRVVRSNTVQTVEVGSDPSLGRELGLVGRSSEGRWEEGRSSETELSLVVGRPQHHRSSCSAH